MGPSSAFVSGIAPDHWPAFFAALLFPVGGWLGLRLARRAAAGGSGRAARFLAGYEAAALKDRVAAGLLLLDGVIHLALVIGHKGEAALNTAFLAAGVLLIIVGLRVFGTKAWRGKALALLLTSIAAYVLLTLSGEYEEPDQVGIATKLVELTAVGLVLVPSFSRRRGLAKLRRPLASTAFVALTVVTGLGLWGASLAAHDHADAASGGESAHHHEHEYAARAQAGIIVRPSDAAATLQDFEAAAAFAQATRAGIAKYADVSAAIADGYKPEGPALGAKRHFGSAANKKDGVILDPARPEMLVYGVDGDRYVLLGAVYQMEDAGEPGPAFAGRLAQWHAHNICATVLPPSFSLVSPFGSCPLASVDVTIPEMIHVWTIDNPRGPYANDLSDSYVRKVLAGKAP
jgi:hypothetical protein